MLTICEGAKDLKACLNAFAEQNTWQKVALGIGAIACVGFGIHGIFAMEKMAERSFKREALFLLITLVALAALSILTFFLKAAQNSALFIVIGSLVCLLPYGIASWVYPEKVKY